MLCIKALAVYICQPLFLYVCCELTWTQLNEVFTSFGILVQQHFIKILGLRLQNLDMENIKWNSQEKYSAELIT